jgi:glutamate N-acetyltransferase/amino-acid N-acetyltransferase
MNGSGSIFLPRGFKFSALAAGIKASGKPDLGLILPGERTAAAALFTKNLVVAAPVEVARASLAKSKGCVRAVIVNSGNANCATGTAGIRTCQRVCSTAAGILATAASTIFPCSTGIIGVPLPSEKINSHLSKLVQSAETSGDHLLEFADAILTTDTHPKLASVQFRGKEVTLTGIAKGSGMIHPQLATMLVFLCADVVATPSELRRSLIRACSDSFNVISIDGDTSTNDTVLLMASGQSGIRMYSIQKEFDRALVQVCRSLAEQIVADGEGVQHLIRLHIQQARSRGEALQVARTISHSALVKTAWAGADPNWGRILAAIGRSGISVNPKQVSISIGSQTVCRRGVGCEFDEMRAHQDLSQPECKVTVRLMRGRAAVEFLTCDLTTEYVRINADYST